MTHDNYSKESQERYLAELKVGDVCWAAIHSCHDRRYAPTIPRATIIAMPNRWPYTEPRSKWKNVRMEDGRVLFCSPDDAPFGLYPIEEMARDARMEGMRLLRD